MTEALLSRQQAEREIANLASESWRIAASEEQAFDGEWLPLGEITLKGLGTRPVSAPGGPVEHRLALVGDGTFEWAVPSLEEVSAELKKLIGQAENGDVRRALDSIACCVVRMGLVNPTFDPAAIEEMPFRRSTTVVSDTSGVLQGGLGFVVRHIPKARVKVPAIVQMEIRNHSHSFFSLRRDAERSGGGKERRAGRLLREHLTSQGGERALLRMELHEDVEIERTYLLGDPLRDAFVPDRDNTVRTLNLSVAHRAYADRLILEAARHHQAQSEPNHPVLLLTSDQGLARMTLAEGARPLYFRAVEPHDVLGQRLVGRPLDPFTGRARPISLAAILWELAVAFGSARLEGEHGTIAVSALGKGRDWSSYHAIDDLLWCEVVEAKRRPSGTATDDHTVPDAEGSTGGEEVALPTRALSVSYQRMNVNHFLALICALDDRQVMTEAEVRERIHLSAYSVAHFRRFLLSGNFIQLNDGMWSATSYLRSTSIAVRNQDQTAFFSGLRRAPSFNAIAQRIETLRTGQPLDLSDLGQSAKTYRLLGELALVCAPAGGEVYPTLIRPAPKAFSNLALARFRAVAEGKALVPVGRWLESLIREEGIHPEVARRSLERASEEGLLRRTTEGSTTQTQFDRHVIHVLRVEDGIPVARAIRIYRGDYLIPGKASVSLRIEEPKREPAR